MDYGCIGERLSHSFSCEVHRKIGEYSYCLQELTPEELDSFFVNRDFRGINVTIPYKQKVIPYCTAVDENARAIGAVNTIVNRGGKLYGYNTDFDGLKALILRMRFQFRNKKILILGTGGTAATAKAVASYLGAREALCVSRNEKGSAVTYSQAYRDHSDADYLINATPCGMHPHSDEMPVNLFAFPRLQGVLDAVYNPLRTRLVSEAAKLGLPSCGGLYMLVHQAVSAARLFTGKEYGEETVEQVYRELCTEKENIVLIGMPGSGKTTVGRLLAEKTRRVFVDTDEEIVKLTGKAAEQLFLTEGEDSFRRWESRVIRRTSLLHSTVIATGGGAVLNRENTDALRQNGRIFFLDRPLEQLVPTADRPLAKTPEAIRKLYQERYDLYQSEADERVVNDRDPEKAVREIERKLSSSESCGYQNETFGD